VHSLLLPDTATTVDICGEFVLTADSRARSVMTVPRQRSTTERATTATDDATGTSKKRLRSVREDSQSKISNHAKEPPATLAKKHWAASQHMTLATGEEKT